MEYEALYWIVAVVLIVLGVAGTVLPALPGAPLVFLGMLLAAWIEGFQRVGWVTLTVLAVLTLLSVAADFVATALGAKRVGASRTAVWAAAAGTLVGLFFGLPGLVLGPFVGAAVGEYHARRDLLQAGRVGFGTWFGLLVATVAKLALVFLMVGVFLLSFAFSVWRG